jgi:hypothetical protein
MGLDEITRCRDQELYALGLPVRVNQPVTSVPMTFFVLWRDWRRNSVERLHARAVHGVRELNERSAGRTANFLRMRRCTSFST